MMRPPNRRAGAKGQRGAFAFMAILLLLVVIAVAIRYLLGASQATTYATSAGSQSVQALMLAESGLERARGMLLSASQSGTLNTACSASGIGAGGPFSLGPETPGTFSYPGTGFALEPPGCSGSACQSCSTTVVGTVGSASRTLTAKGSFAQSLGISGLSNKFSQTFRTTANNTVVFTNIAYQGGSGNTNVLGCGFGTCSLTDELELWSIIRCQGQSCAGGAGLFAPKTAGAVLSQGNLVTVGGALTTPPKNTTLQDPRNFGMVSVIIESGSSTLKLNNAAADAITENTDKGEGTLTKTWCNNGVYTTGINRPNVLLVGISLVPQNLDTTFRVQSIAINDRPVGTPPDFTMLGKIIDSTGSIASEIWGLYSSTPDLTPYLSCEAGNCTVDFRINTTGSISPNGKWVAGFVCLANAAGLPRPLISFKQTQTTWWEPF